MNLHVLTEAWTEALPEAWDCNQSEARSGYTSLPPFVWRKEGNSSHIGQTRLETGLTKSLNRTHTQPGHLYGDLYYRLLRPDFMRISFLVWGGG